MTKSKTQEDKKHLENLYTLAHQLFKSGKMEQALPAFLLLCRKDPTSFPYKWGLGSTYYSMKKYEEAATIFNQCRALDPFTPLPYMQLYKCFHHLNDDNAAKEALNICIKKCQEIPMFHKIKHKANLLLKEI